MSNNKESRKESQKIKVKEKGELASTLSIVLPIIGIFVFLIGGVFLFIFLEEGRRIPNDKYLKYEQLVKDEVLIGLTLSECAEITGTIAFFGEDGGSWTFMGAQKAFKDGEGRRYYEIYVRHENDVAVSAVFRESSE